MILFSTQLRVFIMVTMLCAVVSSALGTVSHSTLGMPFELADVYIPGEKAEPIPRSDRSSSIVIRVLRTKPAADGFRYDFEIYGLDAGSYDLSDYLQYVASKKPVKPIDQTITIESVHDAGSIPKPTAIEYHSPEKSGGYFKIMIVLIALWALVFLLILLYRKKQPTLPAITPPPTLRDKLQVLLTSAAKGELPNEERSQLERLVIGHWKKTLPEIANMPPAEALTALRRHPQASPLLLQLEQWLHAPDPTVSQQDITTLLEPFREA